MWIELTGLYLPDGIDYEGLGISPPDEGDEEPTMVNLNNVSFINRGTKGRVTIQFVDGGRMSFKDSYDDVKWMIIELQSKG